MDSGVEDLIGRLTLHGLDRRLDRVRDGVQLAGQALTFGDHVDRGLHGTTVGVAEHHEQHTAEGDHRVLHGADEDGVGGGVAGHANDEERTEPFVEDVLRREP